MEHISNHLQASSNKIIAVSSSEHLSNIAARLSSEERKVLQLKYASKRFAAMGSEELDRASDAMLIKIHAMTGWNFPDPASAEILKEQFQKKMQESYATVNTDEIEYAFRTYGTTVKDWGKSMNLSLIDEVMIPYLEARNSVSRLEETKQPQIEYKEDLSDKAMRDWYEDVKVRVKNGLHFSFVPVMLYDWLDKKGELAELDTKTKFSYMDAAATYLKGLEQAPTVEAVKNTAKRMILHDVILKQD